MLASPRVIAIPNEVRHMRIKFALLLAFVFVCGCSCAMANATYTDFFDSPFSGSGCATSPIGTRANLLPTHHSNTSAMRLGSCGISFVNI